MMMGSSIKATVLCAAACGLAACATNTPNFTYTPGPAVTSVPPRYRAAVAFASNASGEPADTYNAQNFATCTEGEYYCPVSLPPERLTDVVMRDLAASGFFVAVEREGNGQADVVIRPTIRDAVERDNVNWRLSIDFKVEQKGKMIQAKTYKRNWKTDDLRGDFYAFNQEKLAENLGEIMAEFRADISNLLASMLANEVVAPAAAPAPAPANARVSISTETAAAIVETSTASAPTQPPTATSGPP